MVSDPEIQDLVEQFEAASAEEGRLLHEGNAEHADAAGERADQLVARIKSAGATERIVPLLESETPFVAYESAKALLDEPQWKDAALATLQRLADARLGGASTFARALRNQTLHGDPFPEANAAGA
jgi:hypothetical protein